MSQTISAMLTGSQDFDVGSPPTGQITLPSATDIPASLSPEQLRKGVWRRYDGLRAFDVEYIQNTSSFDWEEERIPRGRYHFAFSGAKRLKAQSNAGMQKPLFYADVMWAWDGELQRTFEPHDQRAYLEFEFETFSDLDLYTRQVGIPLEPNEPDTADRPPASNRPWTYSLDQDELDWVVLPQLELVDGGACHVLRSKNKEKLWIDPAIGFGVRFREGYRRFRDVPQNEWPMSGRSALRDYRLVSGEVWLPWRTEHVNYVTDPAFDTISGQPAWATVKVVQTLAVNGEVPESLFSLQFPVGTMVREKAHNRLYQIGDQGEEIKFGDWE